MEDMHKLNNQIEKEFGFRAVQTAIHRDEGFVNKKTGEPNYNFHGHIVFCNVDKNGKTLLRTAGKSGLMELQDLVAATLGMERGKSDNKHIDHKSYKQMKVLQEENKRLKNIEFNYQQLKKNIPNQTQDKKRKNHFLENQNQHLENKK